VQVGHVSSSLLRREVKLALDLHPAVGRQDAVDERRPNGRLPTLLMGFTSVTGRPAMHPAPEDLWRLRNRTLDREGLRIDSQWLGALGSVLRRVRSHDVAMLDIAVDVQRVPPVMPQPCDEGRMGIHLDADTDLAPSGRLRIYSPTVPLSQSQGTRLALRKPTPVRGVRGGAESTERLAPPVWSTAASPVPPVVQPRSIPT